MAFGMCVIVSNFVKCTFVACVLSLWITQFSAMPTPPPNQCQKEQCMAKLNKYFKDVGMTNTTIDIEKMQKNFNLGETGVIDDDTCNYIINMKRWDRKIITWSVAKAYNDMVPTLEKSFKKWSNKSDLEFVKVDSKYADIQIKFRNISITPCKKNGLVLNSSDADQFACVYPPGDGNGGIVYFSDQLWVIDGAMKHSPWLPDEPWYLSSASLFAIGYALGLDNNNKMGAFVNISHSVRDDKEGDLPEDYVERIQALYGKPSGEQ